MTTLEITALGPLLFRDARPFSGSNDETRAASLPFPRPSTIAGMVRGAVARQCGLDPSDTTVMVALPQIHLKRYWFEFGGEPVFAAPANSLVLGEDPNHPRVCRLVPHDLEEGWGCDMPDGLKPVQILDEDHGGTEGKPLRGYELRTASETCDWLAGGSTPPSRTPMPVTDERVQIQVEPGSCTAAEGKLFTVVFRDWERLDEDPETSAPRLTHWRLQVEIEGDLHMKDESSAAAAPGSRCLAHFGGEHGQVGLTWGNVSFLQAPKELRKALADTTKIVLQLATPAIFKHGWKAAWMDRPETFDAALAGARLVSACVNRPEAVSGWSLDPKTNGPKATRLAAPAGSVYFFELSKPLPEEALDRLWGRAVSDNGNDNNDGFGLALWGVWNR